MICSKCGKENIPGSTFCQYCGNTLNAQTTAAQNIPAQYAPGMQQNPIPPANPAIGTYAPAAPAAQKKNKKTAIIITVVCLVIVLAAGIFIGISMNKKREAEAETTVVTQSANETTEQNANQSTSQSATDKKSTTKKETTMKHDVEEVTGESATADAKINDNDAIELIKSLTLEQLGMSKSEFEQYTDNDDDAHRFLFAQHAFKIDGAKYVQVVAAQKKKNKDGSVTIIQEYKYYISFDGKTILREDVNNHGTFTKIR